MFEILRNLTRRKLRSVLTISGIVIGIFALTTMGALAEHFNALLGGGEKYAESSISVGPPDQQQGALLPLTKMSAIEGVRGVEAVFPTYQVMARPGNNISIGAPDMITNEDPGAVGRGPSLTIASGHDVDRGGSGQVVLGVSMAREFGKKGRRLDPAPGQAPGRTGGIRQPHLHGGRRPQPHRDRT